jgi:toxin YoeB
MRSVAFDPDAPDDLAWWIERDRKIALRVVRLIREVHQTPFEGTG